jgi:hypothetical protein
VVKVVAVTPEAIDVYVPLTVVVDLYTEYEVAWSGETHDIMTVFPLQDPETPLGALTESDFPWEVGVELRWSTHNVAASTGTATRHEKTKATVKLLATLVLFIFCRFLTKKD